MNERITDIIGFFFIGIILGAVLGALCGSSLVRRQAIRFGHADYNPTNANFQWKESK